MGRNRHAVRGTNRLDQDNLGLIGVARASSQVSLDRGIGTQIFVAQWFEYGNCKQRRQHIERNHDGKNGYPAARGLMQTGCKRTAEDRTYALRHVQKTVIRGGMLFAKSVGQRCGEKREYLAPPEKHNAGKYTR